jgi:hypothetical protein
MQSPTKNSDDTETTESDDSLQNYGSVDDLSHYTGYYSTWEFDLEVGGSYQHGVPINRHPAIQAFDTIRRLTIMVVLFITVVVIIWGGAT